MRKIATSHASFAHLKSAAVRTARALAAAAIVALGAGAAVRAQVYNTNLIINGNAEGAAGVGDDISVSLVPGWDVTGNFTAVQYGVAQFPGAGSPGPADRGENFFAGGPSNVLSLATQELSLSDYAADIAGGALAFNISAYLGGFATQGDNAIFRASFLDGSASTIETIELGPVNEAQRGGITGLLFRELIGLVPIGTTDVLFTIIMNRADGAYNDGYADNLSFILQQRVPPVAVPEPSTYALAGAFLLCGIVLARRIRARRPAMVSE